MQTRPHDDGLGEGLDLGTLGLIHREGRAKAVRPGFPKAWTLERSGPGEVTLTRGRKAVKPFKQPVTLAAVKADKRLKDMVLAKQPRLSVQPVTAEEWKIVSGMGGL